MKVAVVGSRTLNTDMMHFFIPSVATEIISGGAKGIDAEAKRFAEKSSLKYTEFIPDYGKYGRADRGGMRLCSYRLEFLPMETNGPLSYLKGKSFEVSAEKKRRYML